MVRCILFITALVAFGVTASAAELSADGENDGEKGIRARRTESEPHMPTCFHFKCPNDYVMIKEPTGEECTNYKCTEPKCCKNVCSSYDCPSGFHPVHDADTTVCNRDKCRRAQCCVLDTVYCNSFQCPHGSSLVTIASSKRCYGKCTESKCCERVCSSFTCPAFSSPVKRSDFIKCKKNVCDEGRCCVPGTGKPFCDSFKCKNGLCLVVNPSNVQCEKDKCKQSECCGIFCTSFDCHRISKPMVGSHQI